MTNMQYPSFACRVFMVIATYSASSIIRLNIDSMLGILS
jgi:hypothetical protein